MVLEGPLQSRAKSNHASQNILKCPHSSLTAFLSELFTESYNAPPDYEQNQSLNILRLLSVPSLAGQAH
jgi:hypothetical protein